MSKKYISQDDYVRADYVLYNNLDEDIFEDIPEVHYTIDEEWLKKQLFKDEEWTEIKHCSGYIVTNLARAFSMRKYKQLSPNITSESLHLFVCKEKIDYRGIFADKGWTFDIETITNNYKKYNWPHREPKTLYTYE